MNSSQQQPAIRQQPPRPETAATRARIAAAAERLFAARGIDAVSLAEINRAAGQRNRSAVQYHFGDKLGVIHAILDKHTPGIERRRHAMLDAIEAEPAFGRRRLVEALVRPVAEKLDDPDGGVAFLRLNAQLIGHPTFSLLALHDRRANRGADRLQRLVSHSFPELPGPRWILLVGLLFHGIADYSRLAETDGGGPSLGSRSDFVENLIDSIHAVLTAPVSLRSPDAPGKGL